MATERDTSKSSWWSNHHHHPSNHLLELQKEIKEEEEEIFADINSLINGGSNLYSTLDDCDDHNNANQLDETTYQKSSVTTTTTTHTSEAPEAATITAAAATTITSIVPTTTITTTTTVNNNISHLRSYTSRHDEQSFYSDSEEEDLLPNRYKSKGANKAAVASIRRDFHSNLDHAKDDYEEDHFHIDSGPPPEEIDFMHQDPYLDHDLTKHDIDDPDYANSHKFGVTNQISQQNYQAFRAVIQHVTSNLPKPCVFFLEGNCRRSDCKYSHDLSNITCKYWIEGFCFKGELCPFLHSYNPPLDLSDPNCLDEEGLKLLAQKELNPTFAIESEADFPSLPLDAPASALNDSTKSSNNTDSLTSTIRDQILSSNPAVVFKTVKKKRKRG